MSRASEAWPGRLAQWLLHHLYDEGLQDEPVGVAHALWTSSVVLVNCLVATVALAFVLRMTAPKALRGSTPAGSRRTDLFAATIVSGLPILGLAVSGTRPFLANVFGDRASSLTSTQRVYGFDGTALVINGILLGYQLFLLTAACVFKEWRTTAFVLQHTAASGIALCSAFSFLHSYAVFHAAFSEWSTVFLVVVDVFKCMPMEWVKRNEAAYTYARVAFALSFILCRLVLWPWQTMLLWADMATVYPHVHSRLVWGYVMVATSMLTLLQFYWGSSILYMVVAKLAPKPGAAGKKRN